jgi:hypothetical protein
MILTKIKGKTQTEDQSSGPLASWARVGKNPGFFKKPSPVGFFGFFWVLGFFGFFGFFWVFWVFLPRTTGFLGFLCT